MLWGLICVVTLLPLWAAAQEEMEFPLLVSTGMPTAATPEEILPVGAIAYVRANNAQMLLENVDSLLTTVVPEKALPPELQEIFANPQPFLTFFSMQAFGQAVGVEQFSELFGIALDRPASLALYPMPPDQGFLLSLPVANAAVITGMAEGAFMPESIEEGVIGEVTYYHVAATNSDLPNDVYIVASEDTAFFCGSMDVLEMLVQSSEMGTLTSDPVVGESIQKYGDRDVTVTLSAAMLKTLLPSLQAQAAEILTPAFMQARMSLQMIPPAQRLAIDSRLRLELGVDGLEQLLDYVEAYATGTYRVVLDQLVSLLMNVDGLTLSINVEQSFQNVALTLFSQDIQTDSGTLPIPLAAVTSALNTLPGDKGMVLAVGKTPEKSSSPVIDAIFTAIEEELTARELSLDGFLAIKDFYSAKPTHSPLTSRADWTVQSLANMSEELDFNQFNSLDAFFKYLQKEWAAKPFMVPVALMPAVESGVIEQYYTEKAEQFTLKGQNYAAMREKLPFKQPLFDLSGQFAKEDLGDGLSRLTVDKIYTSRRGLFGYQQHALINRHIMLHQHTAEYELLYATGLDAATVKTAMEAKTVPIPGATAKLLEQAPAGTTYLSSLRLLHLLPALLDTLAGLEDLTHREFDAFLSQVQELVNTSGVENIESSFVEAKLGVPLLLASLNVDADGNVYATLPGGLHYPRPKVMPSVQELFAEVRANATEVGGSATFVSIQPGAWEVSSNQSVEGLALLVKSVVNNFYGTYMASPEGMEKLFSTLQHPADFQALPEEQIFVNPFWQALLENENLPWASAANESKRSQTVADMRALGTALGSYQVDYNVFPAHPEATMVADIELPEEYYLGATTDGWGMPLVYLSDEDGQNYLLISYGKDDVPGYTDSDFDADIIYMNGQFLAPYDLIGYEDMTEVLNTALLMAVQANAYEVVEALLNNSADPNAEDADGTSALEFATELELTEIMELLEYWGATPLGE